MEPKARMDMNLHCLIVKEGKWIIAHCLDMDIAAQGKTEKEALKNLVELIQVQIEYAIKNDIIDTIFRPAPKEYWDMLYRSVATQVKNRLSLHPRTTLKNIVSSLELAYA